MVPEEAADRFWLVASAPPSESSLGCIQDSPRPGGGPGPCCNTSVPSCNWPRLGALLQARRPSCNLASGSLLAMDEGQVDATRLGLAPADLRRGLGLLGLRRARLDPELVLIGPAVSSSGPRARRSSDTAEPARSALH